MSKRTRRYNRAKTSGTEARRYGQQAGAGGMPATVRTADPTAPQAASASPVNMTLSQFAAWVSGQAGWAAAEATGRGDAAAGGWGEAAAGRWGEATAGGRWGTSAGGRGDVRHAGPPWIDTAA